MNQRIWVLTSIVALGMTVAASVTHAVWPMAMAQGGSGAWGCDITPHKIDVVLNAGYSITLRKETTKEEFLALVPESDRKPIKLCDEGMCEIGYTLLPNTDKEMTLTFFEGYETPEGPEKIWHVNITGKGCKTDSGIHPGDSLSTLMRTFPNATMELGVHGLFGGGAVIIPPGDTGYSFGINDTGLSEALRKQTGESRDHYDFFSHMDRLQFRGLVQTLPEYPISQIAW